MNVRLRLTFAGETDVSALGKQCFPHDRSRASGFPAPLPTHVPETGP